MPFMQRVAIQASTEVRSAKGSTTYTWEVVPGLESVPATVFAVTDERREAEMTVTEDRYDIILGGHHPDIDTGMTVLDGVGVYDILRRAVTLRHWMTVLKARRVDV